MSFASTAGTEAGTGAGGSNNNNKRAIVRSQAREMARRVLDACLEEKLNNCFKIPLCRAMERAAAYTGLSKTLLGRIKREALLAGPSRLRSPERSRRARRRERRCPDRHFDDFGRDMLARCIEEFYLKREAVPTGAGLLLAVRERIEFPWGVRTLQREITRCGYAWRKCQNKRRMLVERPQVVHAREEYLRYIRRYRTEGRGIYYLHETSLNTELKFSECLQATESKESGMTFNRLIMMNVGSGNGLLQEASVVFKMGADNGDYTGHMDAGNFEKWLSEKVLPRLPPNSVVVMDAAAHHCVQENKPPHRGSAKKSMQEWLFVNNVPFVKEMRKSELFRLIDLHKPRDKIFKTDRLIWSHNCDVLRLPPFMCNLSPVQCAWNRVQRIMNECPAPSDKSLTNLHLLTLDAVAQLTADDWAGFNTTVQTLEEDYWRRDAIMEDTIDEFITNAGGEVDGCESDNDSDCSNSSVDTDSDKD